MASSIIGAAAQTFANLSAASGLPALETFENRNPADTGDLVGLFARGTSGEIEAACVSAAAALPGWAGMPAPARGAVLFRAAEIIESDATNSRPR